MTNWAYDIKYADQMKEAHLSKADFKTSEYGFKGLFLTSDDW